MPDPQALLKHGITSYVTALQAVPRNLRAMYIHAYQSFLWNSAASFRLGLSPDSLLPGDLVMERTPGTGSASGQQSTSPPSSATERAPADGELPGCEGSADEQEEEPRSVRVSWERGGGEGGDAQAMPVCCTWERPFIVGLALLGLWAGLNPAIALELEAWGSKSTGKK